MVSKSRLFKDETPGEGRVIFDKGVKIKKKENEIRIARWLVRKYGGEYKILNESKNLKWKTPDILRNNAALIEVKIISGETSFKNRLGEATQQLLYKYNKIAKISKKIIVLEVKDGVEVSIQKLRHEMVLRFAGKGMSEISAAIIKYGDRMTIVSRK